MRFVYLYFYVKIKKTKHGEAPFFNFKRIIYFMSLSKGCHLDVVRGPSTPHDPERDAGGSLSSWQGHPSR
jgi:hypothetical protein